MANRPWQFAILAENSFEFRGRLREWRALAGIEPSLDVIAPIRAGWGRRFEDPIPLPRGRQLVTLKEADNYIPRLPKRELEATEWQAAMEALIRVATSGGPDDVRIAQATATLRVRESLGVGAESLGSSGRPLSRAPVSM